VSIVVGNADKSIFIFTFLIMSNELLLKLYKAHGYKAESTRVLCVDRNKD
ncbi:MAG: hypothetical protein ACJAU1_001560, partial [Psychromonas sp.]